MEPQNQQTGFETHTGFFPLAFILFLCSPIIEINGQKVKTSWGTRFFDAQPGNYTVKIYFKYVWMEQCGANQVQFTLEPGQVRRIQFNMPPWMFSKGTMRIS